MRQERDELTKKAADFGEKQIGYLRIKKLIEEIEVKYTHRYDGKGKEESYNCPLLLTYEEFKEKVRGKKEEVPAKAKKADFYHHIAP